MKKIVIYTISIAFMGFFASCQKWLNVIPENDQVSDLYWQDKEEAEAVLGAAYLRLRETVETQLIWGEARGNGLALGGFQYVDVARMKQFDLIPANNMVKWDKFYQVINLANMVIKYAPDVVERDPSFSEPVMRSLLAEAYFLRALSYFVLVRNFKEVPLILEPYMNDLHAFEIPKSTEKDIIGQIIQDLEGAIPSSKETWPQVWEMKGRATKWSIYATLADVYLWAGEYDKAIDACDKVMNSGWLGLLQGVVNNDNQWFTIFSEGNTNEGIFELQFDFSKNQTNGMLNWFGTQHNWVISPLMVDYFEQSAEDIRGVGSTYQASDYKLWKYIGAEAGTTIPRPNSDQNWIMYRMADIYFMKAEALVMKGEAHYDEALTLINQVRMRAGVSAPADLRSTELEMLDLVITEKAMEFVGEGKRWYDMLRVGRINNYEYKEYLISNVLLGSAGGSAPVIRSKLLNENSHYLPIHTDELRANRALVQNPYYENLN